MSRRRSGTICSWATARLTDWRFVDFKEVPSGPWALYGDNNTFVIERRKSEEAFAKRQ